MSANSLKYADNLLADKAFILTEAGRCVACGLCLPHCPTYQLTQLESESPRGRIALISALASNDLAATETLGSLLHHCLLCRTCEKMSPSSVSFSSIMDKGRNLHRCLQTKKTVKRLFTSKLTDFMLHHPEWIRVAGNIISPINFIIRNNAKKSGHRAQSKRSLSDYLPFIQTHRRWKSKYLTDKPKKHVSLFLGCVARNMDGGTLDDAIYVLNKIGYSVNIPAGQVCCGALSLHSGREQDSTSLMKKNILAFDATQKTPIIYTASGCGYSLGKYLDYQEDKGFSSRAVEICQFINDNWPEKLHLNCQKQKILVHTPCSMDANADNGSAADRMLNRFTNLSLLASASAYSCCGASGTKMLTDLNTSNSLRDPLLGQIKKELPDVVLSSNIGCALHLAEGLRQARLDIPVKHPVSLLADIFRDNEQAQE